jgi:2-polyprenyl-3-methyl-5-hydroxy-6-metoxy-1,4-benzoquinol methylase
MGNVALSLTKQHTKIYDLLADEYERNVPNYLEPTKEAVDKLSSKLKKGMEILDVGCGAGVASGLLQKKGFKVTSNDLSSKMISYVKKRNPKGKVITGDFLTLDYVKKYDALIALAFIHLFPKYIAVKVIKKMHRLIKPNGYLYIGTSKSKISKEGWEIKRDIFYPDNKEKRYRKHWTQKELKNVLCENGFDFVELYLIKDPRKMWMDFLVRRTL